MAAALKRAVDRLRFRNWRRNIIQPQEFTSKASVSALGGRYMTGMFISPMLDSLDVFLGFSLIIFVAGLIATYGEQITRRP